MPCRPESVSVAITGASGVRVGLRVVETLHRMPGVRLQGVIVSRGAIEVAKVEEPDIGDIVEHLKHITKVYLEDDFASPLASSSNQPDAMAIVPASTKTIALIANGVASNLTARAALAIIRLGRRLVVAPRESPLGVVELENMLRLARAGAVIVPLSPGFYTMPRSVEDIVNFMAGKVLDALGLTGHGLYRRWGEA